MKRRSRFTPAAPVEVKRGNITLKIYRGTNRVGSREYPQFTLTYYSGSERVKRRFADLADAKREAELAAAKLASGESEVLKLNSLDRAVYLDAQETLRPLDVPLNVAVNEYAAAVRRLPPGTTLREAVDFFIRRSPSSFPEKKVQEVVDELVASKTQAGRSKLHLQDLKSRLGRFAQNFPVNISRVTGALIQQHLDSLKVTGRTRRNHLRLIVSLFKFAVRRKYLGKEALEELEAVERPEILPTETLIFTPSELREMLYACRPELVPWLAIAAFCGLRTAEIMRLDWAQVNLERRFVEVKALNAKTASRRLVPLCDAAVAWLAPSRKSQGRLAYYAEENKFCSSLLSDVNKARKAAGNKVPFKWKRNGLRHSFCSYRLAVTSDAAKTALEAGNSPAMVFRHYRELVTDQEAAEWFGIMPRAEENVIPIPFSVEN